MAARQASQSNAMMYALVTFVALFIIATVFAVIYYVKSEDFRTQAELAKEDLNSIVTSAENSSLARIVGTAKQGKSYLGTMQQIVNSLYSFILGKEPPADLPATVKFNEISRAIDTLNKNILGEEDVNPAYGPNGVALLKTIEELKQKLENARNDISNLEQLNQRQQADLEAAVVQSERDKQEFQKQLNLVQAELDQINDRFNKLRQNMQTVTEQQLQEFQNKLEAEQAKLKQKQLDLQKAKEQLNETGTLLKGALTKLDAIKPKPDKEVQAYEPDAQILRIDLQNGIVYLDAGINDHVYRGLTFAVYDRNKPIPEDGKSKAEIEVFQVTDQVCAARIVESDKKNPMVMEDIVANLIWDRKATNHFLVSGEFDFNNDGLTDPDGAQRIVELIERWGGRIDTEISVDTDFLVLGEEPKPLARPTQQELDINPLVQQRYEQSLQKVKAYNAILQKALDLDIPVFNQKRFLYLIGYDTLMHKNPML